MVATTTKPSIVTANRIEVPYRLERIPANQLTVDPQYQRRLDQRWAKKIAAEFDPDKLRPLDVSRRDDGTYWVMDGGHRRAAIILMGWGDQLVPCNVYTGLTLAEEAKIFDTQQSAKGLTARDRFRSRLIRKDPDALEILRDVEEHGFTLNLDDAHGGHGRLTTIAALEEARKSYGRQTLRDTLRVMRAVWGDETEGIERPLVRGLAAFLARYHDSYSEKRLIDQLQEYTPYRVIREAKDVIGGRTSTRGIYHWIAVAMILREIYNVGLRSRRLIAWDEARPRHLPRPANEVQ